MLLDIARDVYESGIENDYRIRIRLVGSHGEGEKPLELDCSLAIVQDSSGTSYGIDIRIKNLPYLIKAGQSVVDLIINVPDNNPKFQINPSHILLMAYEVTGRLQRDLFEVEFVKVACDDWNGGMIT